MAHSSRRATTPTGQGDRADREVGAACTYKWMATLLQRSAAVISRVGPPQIEFTARNSRGCSQDEEGLHMHRLAPSGASGFAPNPSRDEGEVFAEHFPAAFVVRDADDLPEPSWQTRSRSRRHRLRRPCRRSRRLSPHGRATGAQYRSMPFTAYRHGNARMGASRWLAAVPAGRKGTCLPVARSRYPLCGTTRRASTST